MSDDDGVEPESSVLGTKEYWDEAYERELENFESFGDEGELWFGREAETRMVKWLEASGLDRVATKILDLGTGNGHLLGRLKQSGFVDLTGVDYSQAAVELARKVAAANDDDIRFEVLDILDPAPGFFKGQFDVLLDKGTWDAISLGEDRDENGRKYRAAILEGLKPGGRLLIVSCNFTREELEKRFAGDDLAVEAELPSKTTFSFGGAAGKTTSGVVFRTS